MLDPELAIILVVDDDTDIRETIIEALEDDGYSAAGAKDGADALRFLAAASSQPCLILLDMMMPNMNGYQFLEEQLKHPQWSTIPVVVVTANGHIEEKPRQLGAVGLLRKPVKLESLIDTVARYCGEPRQRGK